MITLHPASRVSVALACVLVGFLIATAAEAPAPIQPAEYARRRMALASLAGPDSVVVVADAEHQDLGRAGADFRYLTGGSVAGAMILINHDPEHPKSAAIAFPEGTPAEKTRFWNGKTLTTSELEGVLKEVGSRSAPVYASSGAVARIQRAVRDLVPQKVDPLTSRLRAVKSGAESALTKRAIEITIQAHRKAAATCKPGKSESDLQAVIVQAFRSGGSPTNAFPCIVGSGPNSCIPHYFDNNRTMVEGDLVVIDIGAEYGDYSADLTRTYPVNGKFAARQLQLYLAVLESQRAAEKAAQPGSSLGDLDRAVRSSLRSSPLRAKRSDGEDSTLDAFFSHGIGHSIGLEVHDPMPAGAIPIGAIFTIEPGVYIESESIGIRIEDDYLMTDKGAVNLSASLPSNPYEIQKLMSSAITP